MDQLFEVLRDFVQLFERLDITYAVMGGLAVRTYGIPRPTYDVDFTIAVLESQWAEVVAAAQNLGYDVPEHQERGWLDQVAGMPMAKFHFFVEARKIDVDVFLAQSAFQSELLKRRRREQIHNLALWMVTPEDLLLLKLIASRPRDLADVADVLFTQGQLDLAYLRTWADQLRIRAELEKSLQSWSSP